VKKKQEINNISLTQAKAEKCDHCNTISKYLAEFNTELLCAHCFEQMIRIRVSGRKDDIFEEASTIIRSETNPTTEVNM